MLCIVVGRNYAIWLKHFVYWGESNLGVIDISYFLWGVRKKMYQTWKTPPPIRDFMTERSLKLTKIFNLNLLKFDCQNLPFRRSLASSKLNPFLFPQELKFNLKTTSKMHVWVLGGRGVERDTA